jgi:MOB kinase activator 1
MVSTKAAFFDRMSVVASCSEVALSVQQPHPDLILYRIPCICRDPKKSLRPAKGHEKGTKQYTLHTAARATLGSGDLAHAVALPEGTEMNEWLDVHIFDFYNEISLLYGTVIDFCTISSCPKMCAGPKYEYLWADGVKVVTPKPVSAPEYVDLLMTWIEEQLDNESIFPRKPGAGYPANFSSVIARNIFKRLFRVYAHIYHHHHPQVVELGAEAHLNSCFKHFIFFIGHFKLVDEKELAPLDPLISALGG